MRRTSVRTASYWAVLLTLTAAALSATSCTKSPVSEGENLYQVPWPTATGEYKLQNVPIRTFDDPMGLQGRYAKILIDPYDSGGSLQSSKPVGRFAKNSDGVVIPADFATLQATTFYAHMERLFEIDQALGVADKVRWPLTVGLQANVIDKDTRTGKEKAMVNNAVYDGRLDAMLVVPYFLDKLPIVLNGGILAHEHFHTIFHALVLKNLVGQGPVGAHEHGEFDSCNWVVQQQERKQGLKIAPPSREEPAACKVQDIEVPPRVFNQYLARGMNEGLADFWGWVYTGDTSFIGKSLQSDENDLRRMDKDFGQLPDVGMLKSNLKDPCTADGMRSERQRNELAYRLGTYYARFMRELASQVGGGEASLEARLVVARALIESLPRLRSAFETSYESEYVSPNALLKPLVLSLPTVTPSSCNLFQRFAAYDEGGKPTVCETEPVPAVSPSPKPQPGSSPVASPVPAASASPLPTPSASPTSTEDDEADLPIPEGIRLSKPAGKK